MTRFNLILLIVTILSALSVVTTQHYARKLLAELEREQQKTKQLEEEWGQLRLEQSTWAMPARVEKIARDYLGMTQPTRDRVLLVSPAAQAEEKAP